MPSLLLLLLLLLLPLILLFLLLWLPSLSSSFWFAAGVQAVRLGSA
jgi:hypothetical protein